MSIEPTPDIPEDVRQNVIACGQRYMAAKERSDAAAMESALSDAWASYPEPKHGWSDSQSMVHRLIAHLRDNQKAAEALALSNEQIAAGFVRDYQSEPWMYRGSVLVALGQFKDATKVFADVIERFGKRAFAGHDARLLHFAESGEVPAGLYDAASASSGAAIALQSEIPAEVHNQILALSEAGDDLQLAGDWQGAVAKWRQAIELLPTPKTFWDAASWLFGSIGDALVAEALNDDHIERRDQILIEAREALVDAIAAPDGATNPLLLMRRGQAEFIVGDATQAREFLLKAYMLDGEAVFEQEGPQWLDILADHGDI